MAVTAVPTELRLAEKILARAIQELEEAPLEMDSTIYGQHEIIRALLPSLKEWLKSRQGDGVSMYYARVEGGERFVVLEVASLEEAEQRARYLHTKHTLPEDEAHWGPVGGRLRVWSHDAPEPATWEEGDEVVRKGQSLAAYAALLSRWLKGN